MIEVEDEQLGHCYMLTEKEYCEYQCLKQRLDEWNQVLEEAKECIKDLRGDKQ